jgi:hypothetical protein
MLNTTILIKVKERINKLSSNDYDNIESWQIVEAFNKGQVDWCRRNLHGLNVVKEGDEQSNRRVDDLEVLLTITNLLPVNRETFYEIDRPADYLQWKRLSASGKNDCCPDARPLVIYLAEEANVDILLRDKNKKPSFEWAETFCTQKTNKIQIYTNGEFEVVNPQLTYYKQPTRIQIAGIVNPYTGVLSTTTVDSEFKDDLVEVFIDEAVKILAGDIESMNQVQRATQAVENNN